MKNEELISFEDLKAWLGYSQASRIVRWLTQRGIEHEFDADGRPITTRTWLTRRSDDGVAEVQI